MTAALNANEVGQLKHLVQQLELSRLIPLPGAGKGLWHIEDVDLASIRKIGVGMAYGAIALKNGSTPGARVKLTVNGSELRQFGPGSKFTAPCEEITAVREDGSASAGTLRLLILDSPYADLYEGDVKALAPVALLGSRAGGGYTFVAVTEDTDPSGATVTGAFDASGFEKIRILIDGQTVAANFTTADLVPWSSPDYVPGTAGTWFEQGEERRPIPDSDTSGVRYRVIVMTVSGAGYMYLSIRNLLAAARTGLGFYIEGIK